MNLIISKSDLMRGGHDVTFLEFYHFVFFAILHTTQMINIDRSWLGNSFGMTVMRLKSGKLRIQHTAAVLSGELDIPLQIAIDHAYQVLCFLFIWTAIGSLQYYFNASDRVMSCFGVLMCVWPVSLFSLG